MARVGIAGAGIIGTAIAVWLLGEGHEVTVYDADPEGLPTSTGNAALIALPEIAPIATAANVLSVPGWLVDPLGPLTVRWADLPALTPWLMAFLAAAVPAREKESRRALTSVLSTALKDHQDLQERAATGNHLRQVGYLSVHDSARSLAAAADEASRVKAALGFPWEQLSPDAARKLMPRLEGVFHGAIHQPSYWMVDNPLTILRAYQGAVRQRGKLLKGKVIGVDPAGERATFRLADGKSESFDFVVVASGVWSRELVRKLELSVLLESERGYNTTYTDLDWNLPMPLGFPDHGFVATPLVDGLRVGGAVELAKPESLPNFARAAAMRQKMRRYVPSLPEGGKEWMGRRPSTPDSLPVVAAHPRNARVLFAFGHGHLGLTLSAVTAKMIASLVAGVRDPRLAAFDIRRFGH